MPRKVGGIAAFALVCLVAGGVTPALAQSGDPLGVGRKMLAEDNPGELWVERGKTLFYQKRGPKNASLERCDFGMGPGQLAGAYAALPRYFQDTDAVQDLESRLVTCMVALQGYKRGDLAKTAMGNLDRMSDVEALVAFIASRSNGMKMNVPLSHQKEYDAYKAGEYIFYRRNGPTDFGCITCHGENGKRIRLQDLPNMTDRKQLQDVVTSWPAYLGTQSNLRTMQWRLKICYWQMRLPDLAYLSDISVAITSYLNYQGNGAVIGVPGVKR
ncbi:MAG: sulfur oxidation c-type cytochrome SoxA [Betaproteobacteria bacterium RIFCSPLOWO2_02_FULL_67_26]|nr:MAG: sulfur oxidation c-type cytochrome SoxA [Betaproteobacteria bacterium RIFCSPLOWO2_02_FULL_67_26]